MRAPRCESLVQRGAEQPGNSLNDTVSGVAGSHFGSVLHHASLGSSMQYRRDIPEQTTEKRRVNLLRSVVLVAEIFQIGAIRESVLRNKIAVTTVKFLVLCRL